MEEAISETYNQHKSEIAENNMKRQQSTRAISKYFVTSPRYKSEVKSVKKLTPVSPRKHLKITLPATKQSSPSRNYQKFQFHTNTDRYGKKERKLSKNVSPVVEKLCFTYRENEIIRNSIGRYEAFAKSRIKKIPPISYMDLKERFEDVDNRITFLMMREIVIKGIEEFADYEVSMEKGSRKQYHITAKKRASPLRIHIVMEHGIRGGEFFFSQCIPRPTISNCDKSVPLASKEVIARYFPNKEHDIFFTRESIYITIEAYKDIALTFQCVFGKGILALYL
eukprot:TRINITY_DN12580_c0_g1_i1.p1 TRINITY_DN12580_c0_g1~~TRINITY_DN12580_c0_g1_i1.p1  ORF type:complete len:281 (-),score=31.44 TRINITY_DN12580_c0_g1_i1:578-1420(-)